MTRIISPDKIYFTHTYRKDTFIGSSQFFRDLMYFYDKSGKRHMISWENQLSVNSNENRHPSYVKGLELSEIESLVYRQKFHTRSFDNINVDYLTGDK